MATALRMTLGDDDGGGVVVAAAAVRDEADGCVVEDERCGSILTANFGDGDHGDVSCLPHGCYDGA